MKVPRRMLSAALIMFVSLSCSLPAYAEYSYQIVHPPGADNARLWGVNNAGTAVGWTSDEFGNFIASFEYDIKKGGYTMLGNEFVAMAISNTGMMVGNPGATPWKCAIRDKQGNISMLYPPSWNEDLSICDARGVNPDGKVSGFVIDEFGVMWGFIYDPEYGTFEEFLPSGYTIGHGINAQGQHVGNVENLGYVREEDGSVKTFLIEGSAFDFSVARGISENGLMTGWFYDGDTWAATGFVTTLPETEGFSTISLAEDEIVHISPCDPDLEPAPPGYFVLTDVITSDVRNDGVVVGFCVDYYISDDWNDSVQHTVYGLIATPVK